ncbi:MAG TPA: hypothetical protein VGL65_13255 [Gemmatimonadales bacterium]|jgi:uncharacterized BrkB/YihY/UPF0761 family membrane protein
MKIASRPLVAATAVGTVLQLVMVSLGHRNPDIASLYAPIGIGISCVAGVLYAVVSTEVILRDNVVGGLVAGAVCAFIGIAVSCLMHDVAPLVLIYGTISSAVGGAIGGAVGRLFSSGRV